MFSAISSKLGFEPVNEEMKSKSFYDLKAELPGSGKFIDFAEFKGKVVLIINTASKCGFTPQYKGLQKLHEEFGDKGLAVVGFPCNQFAHQEPAGDSEIAEACQVNHGVTFPLAKKSDVNGANQNQVFAWLKAQPQGKGIAGTTAIKWNFEKFLVGRDGTLLHRYSSLTTPETIKTDIEKAL